MLSNPQSTFEPVFAPGVDFDDIEEKYFTRVELRSFVGADATLNETFVDEELLDNEGRPRLYYIDELDDHTVTLRLMSTLGCALDWCRGHHAGIEANRWEDLRHTAKQETIVTLPPATRSEAAVERFQDASGVGDWVCLNFEGDCDATGLEALAASLRTAADRLMVRASQLRELR